MTREELRAALGSVTVVDAQPPARYGQRHLPGALNLVAEDSEEHVTGALADAGAPVVGNVGDVPLLVVSVHERGTLRQTWLGVDPA